VAAFIALFKVAPGILLLHFVAMRRWRAVAGMVGAGLVMAGASVAHVGVGTYLEFLPLAKQMSYGSSTWSHTASFYRDPFNQSINSFLHHVLSGASGETTPWLDLGPAWANRLTALLTLLILSATVAVGWRVGRALKPSRLGDPMPPGERLYFGAVVMIGLLIPSLMWDHYMTIAMVPWCLLLLASPGRWRVPCLLTLLMIGAVLGWPVMHHHPDFTHGAGLLVMSLRLWPALLLWAWCCLWAWQQGSGSPPRA
jgi:hypothetical protein